MIEEMKLFAVPGLPLIAPGDDVAQLIVEQLAAVDRPLHSGDILVIAQKIVSKAENRLVRLADVVPDAHAIEVAEATNKDPRRVQVVLDDSNEIVRARPGVLIVEQKSGWICAHGGTDRSNVPTSGDDPSDEVIALLPANADASAEGIRSRIQELTGCTVGVIINDSHGRPWRVGTVGICIGCAGLPPLWNQRGLHDLYGYELVASEECIVDELAAAASLLMGQSNEGRPVVVIRGYTPPAIPPASSRIIQRPKHMDLFR
jgi:coenzyme F420-0:L-glutamate ligase/coenzyme F420-1:gamma-L-glutamate ligase